MKKDIIDLNGFVADFKKDPIQAKLKLVLIANKEILEAIEKGYYSTTDLEEPNYTEICEWCGFPDFQDGGIFEKIINIAINLAANLNDFKIYISNE